MLAVLLQAQRSFTFQIRESLNEFLREQHAIDKQFPSSLQELEICAGIRLVVADRADPDDVGFVQWRTALYAINLESCLLLIDGWLRYKQQRKAPAMQLPDVQIHLHTGVEMKLERSDFKYQSLEINDPAINLPLKVFEAQPVVGKRITTAHFQIESDDALSLVITGYIWPFRNRLDDLGLCGGYLQGESSQDDPAVSRSYCRVWKGIDASNTEECSKIFEIVQSALRNVVVRVIVDKEPEPDSAVERLLLQLKKIPNLFFNEAGDDSDS